MHSEDLFSPSLWVLPAAQNGPLAADSPVAFPLLNDNGNP
jgi:hypothetical protein